LALALLALSAALWWVFQATRPLPGLESKGGAADIVPWVSLAGACVSLLGSAVTLALKVIELKSRK
jgi:hypothetical protein